MQLRPLLESKRFCRKKVKRAAVKHTRTRTGGGVVVVLVGPEVSKTRERQSEPSGTKARVAAGGRGGQRVVFIAASA